MVETEEKTTETPSTPFYPQRPFINRITHLVSPSGSVLIFNSNMKLVYEYLVAWASGAPHILRYKNKQDNLAFAAWLCGLSESALKRAFRRLKQAGVFWVDSKGKIKVKTPEYLIENSITPQQPKQRGN